jgi:hypothetical protein
MEASGPRPRVVDLFVVAAVVAMLATASGCGETNATTETSATTDSAAESQPSQRPASRVKAKPEKVKAEHVAPSRCPVGLAGCRSTEGRIVYVEKVDPDGDGDAHFVVVDPRGVTLPGLTAIDVRKGLRPDPLPGIGGLISAAGPVQTGSYGQSQIHALVLHVAAR